MSELPPGWARASIGQVTMPFESIDPSRSPDTWFDYIDIGSIDNATQRVADTKRFLGRDAPSRARRLVETGDILFSTVRTYLKNIARVPQELDGAVTSTGIAVLRPSEALDGSYLFRWVCSAPFLEAISKAQDGTLYPAVSDRDVAAAAISIPPLAEQRRIVAKLDALTARTARARADLDRIPALAARYKQAVLAKAFRGELLNYGHGGGANRGWRYGKASEVCGKVQSGGTPRAGFSAEGVPFLKVYNIVNQRVDFEYRSQYISDDVHARELRKSAARPGDVLMNIVGPPLGKVAIIPSDFPEWNINQALTLFRPTDEISSKWLFYFLCGGDSVQSVINETRGSAGQVNISLSQCREFVLPVPPVNEQAEIVLRIETAFADIDRMTTQAAAARHMLDRLDRTVLTKAFRGELVSQDPADEPASDLLERLRADRTAAPKSKRKPSPRAPAIGKKTDMPKSRLDDDVKHQPFLASILKASGKGLSPDSLFKSADLPITDFYKQLAWEIDNGLVNTRGEILEAA